MIKPTKDNSFCFYPFYAMVFKLWKKNSSELRAVAPCCMMHDTKDITGEYNSILTAEELKGLSPYDIFHHKKFENLRKNLLNNKRDPRCSTCWNLEDKGILSHRLYTRWQFPEEFKTDLKEIDISLSNKCNLACRMCNTGSSHQLYQDVDKLKKINKLNMFEQASGKSLGSSNLPKDTNDNHLIRWIHENTDKIKVFKASGGEPLYDNNILNILKKFVIKGNSKDTELVLHTNGMLITDDIIKLMNKFKMQRPSLSIDGVDSTYNYIRHKSDFVTLENTLKHWLKHSTNVYALNVNLVLDALNLGNVVDFLEWTALMFHNKVRCNIFISEVRPHGRGIDIINLPITYLETIQKNIIEYKDGFEQFRTKKYEYMHSSKYFHYEVDKLLSLIEYAITNNVCDISSLYTEITLLDETRNQSYKDFLDPSLISILENYEREINR
jgi:MoaA/NifB/PqqE/SkfB family radical SAM enzyme